MPQWEQVRARTSFLIERGEAKKEGLKLVNEMTSGQSLDPSQFDSVQNFVFSWNIFAPFLLCATLKLASGVRRRRMRELIW